MTNSKPQLITFSNGDSFLVTDMQEQSGSLTARVIKNETVSGILYNSNQAELSLILYSGDMTKITNCSLLAITGMDTNPFR